MTGIRSVTSVLTADRNKNDNDGQYGSPDMNDQCKWAEPINDRLISGSLINLEVGRNKSSERLDLQTGMQYKQKQSVL